MQTPGEWHAAILPFCYWLLTEHHTPMSMAKNIQIGGLANIASLANEEQDTGWKLLPP